MDHGVGAIEGSSEPADVGQVVLDERGTDVAQPAGPLRVADERDHIVATGRQRVRDCAADEPGAPGQGDAWRHRRGQ